MKLEEYKKHHNYSYETLSHHLGFCYNKVFRICKERNSITLRDAYTIVEKTGNEVTLGDLNYTKEVTP